MKIITREAFVLLPTGTMFMAPEAALYPGLCVKHPPIEYLPWKEGDLPPPDFSFKQMAVASTHSPTEPTWYWRQDVHMNDDGLFDTFYLLDADDLRKLHSEVATALAISETFS
jgi:hypothetical protein